MPIRLNLTDVPPQEPETEPNTDASAGPARLPDGSLGVAVETAEEATVSVPSFTNGSGPPQKFRRNKYEGLDHTDLLHIIEEIEDNRSWVSLREKLWIALIIHMLVAWYLLYGPKYIYHVHVVDPSVIMKQRQKDLTSLDLLPDALKQVKPKPAPLSDKNRVAQTPHPTLDKKTLEQLEAMR